MPSTTFKPFDIVAVPFPFTDKAASKKRPALVISNDTFNADHDQLVLAMITTAQNSHWSSDAKILDWPTAGLKVPCVVRLKIFTLDRSIVLKHVGALSFADQKTVKAALSSHLVTA